MKALILVVLACAASAFSALAFVLDDNWLNVPVFGLLAILVLISWRIPRPGWIGAVVFGLMGIGSLLARFWLRAHVGHSQPALDAFGPGFIVMAVISFVYNRAFRRAPEP